MSAPDGASAPATTLTASTTPSTGLVMTAPARVVLAVRRALSAETTPALSEAIVEAVAGTIFVA